MKLVNTLKTKVAPAKDKALNFIRPALLVVASALMSVGAFAGDKVNIGNLSGMSTDALVGSIVGIVLTLARYIGIILVVTGVFQLVMAYKDDNADAKTRGVQLAIVGIILITLKSILTAAGILA